MNNPVAPFLSFPECGYPGVPRNEKKMNPNTASGKQQEEKKSRWSRQREACVHGRNQNGCLTPASDKWELSTDWSCKVKFTPGKSTGKTGPATKGSTAIVEWSSRDVRLR